MAVLGLLEWVRYYDAGDDNKPKTFVIIRSDFALCEGMADPEASYGSAGDDSCDNGSAVMVESVHLLS